MKELKNLIRILIKEILDEDILKNKTESDPDVKEFSGAAAIAGFTAPLGYSAHNLQFKKPVTKKKGKKKK